MVRRYVSASIFWTCSRRVYALTDPTVEENVNTEKLCISYSIPSTQQTTDEA
ncbi:hypothetical protein COEREDRAFT_83703 [Coemansia reversa NRRL 1564]|uniref:Uncharacterized protein n=1 Tax=Coemansia reversa (strain ATCC 12441 / NRRL 1564) TaxID=763665 RepID=A0A2G5B285_COERN|nr:hypothetical protein COEREDRAFT_83703 [Coemansia reversa NRRL 1564]|eukprot:PIA13130.1 hypothetical protein COEREDRAFT_83703 [Coemansia reversa NRRL 1564]